jgi:hypothetical protein
MSLERSKLHLCAYVPLYALWRKGLSVTKTSLICGEPNLPVMDKATEGDEEFVRV